MIRKLAGIAVGIAVAVLVMIVAEAIGYRAFGIELGPDGSVPATAAIPDGVQATVIAGWFLAGLSGGYAAVWLSRTKWTAWAVAGVIWAAVILRFALAAAPTWMIVGGIAAPPLAGWLAQQLPRRRTAA